MGRNLETVVIVAMRYLSVCSGIEAATVAWHPLGWEPAAFAEIDAFPSAVLAHHYPAVLNAGDFTELADVGAVDLLVGGTPCQDFSIAGLRAGVAGDRGNLTLEFLRLADRSRPKWVVWENVPGVLSVDDGRTFGAVLGGLAELGYGWAYRVLDAQYFGVPQRRRRVFVIGCLGDERRAAAVLFERASLSGHPTPRREAPGVVAGALGSGSPGWGGRIGADEAARNQLVTHTLKADGFDASEDGTGRGVLLVAGTIRSHGSGVARTGNGETEMLVAFTCKDYGGDAGAVAPTLRSMEFDGSRANGGGQIAVAGPLYYSHDYNQDRVYGTAGASEALTTARKPNFMVESGVRRLTPRECERLQGFPDDYTLVPFRKKPAADGPRYRALGNSMAVPVMRWIGERIMEIA